MYIIGVGWDWAVSRHVATSGTIAPVTGGRAAAQTAADKRDVIRVVGAHENNLRGVDVVIPKRRLTVFTGVSGSGKSSLVFATIAAESRRLINETYPALQRGGRKVVERKRFSVQGGMCPTCEGVGKVSDIDLTQVLDETLSLEDGAITVPGYAVGGWQVRSFTESGLFPADKPVSTFTPRQRNDLLYKDPTKIKVGGINVTYEGLVSRIRRSMLSKEPETLQPRVRAFVQQAVVFGTCPQCDGTRLSEPARTCLIDEKSIADACAMQISDLAQWITHLQSVLADAAPLLANLKEMLDAFVSIGLGYLSLDRPAATLSGGEAQRTKLVRHLGSALTDVTYVFDEPSIGLHPHDLHLLNELLLSLRDKGNTVLVIEHKPETIEIADHVVDLGPGAGDQGGRICFDGTVEQLRDSDTLTGRHLTDHLQIKNAPRSPAGKIQIRGASTNNLRHVDVDIPTGVLAVVTGVAGSGKSSLIHGHLSPMDDVVTIDQSPIKGSRRSNPATYTGLLDHIRKAFAKANKDKGAKPAYFSANSEGACPVCGGSGVIETQLGFMETVESCCEACQGRRFNDEVLAYRLGGRSIADVLDMSVTEALEFFSRGETRLPAASRILARLTDVGLGYLRLGQALTTLSGGERQRLKLAVHLGKERCVVVLDEPTVGLHPADIEAMLALLDRIVDSGRTVVVIEHHQAVMAHADWVIDMGPGAGHDGGRVVFTGTPAQMVADRRTLTGRYLARYVEKGGS